MEVERLWEEEGRLKRNPRRLSIGCRGNVHSGSIMVVAAVVVVAGGGDAVVGFGVERYPVGGLDGFAGSTVVSG